MENINSNNEVEKAVRPEVTKEQLAMVVEHLMEAIESIIEVPEEESEDTESEDSTEIEDMSKSEHYISDDEHEDKWNNLEKACWSGYKQVGMKDKNGKQVPNCVPINKATGLPEEPKPTWSGAFRPIK